MGDETSPDRSGSAPQHPFPSRKDVHSSRIPKTNAENAAPNERPAPVERDPGTPTLREAALPPMRTRRSMTPSAPLPTQASAPAQPAETAPRVPAQPVARPSVAQQAAPTAVPTHTGSIALAQKKKRARRRAVRTTLTLLFLAGLVAAGLYFAFTSLRGSGAGTSEPDDYPGPGTGSVEITVDPGDLGTDIAAKLYEADVVKSQAAFIRAFDNNSASSTIRPGTYALKQQMSAAGALAAMLDETNRRDNTVTVNGGQTVSDIEGRLVAFDLFSAEEVEAALADPAAIGLPEVAEGNPEGWLAAGAYEVATNDTAASVISQMVAKQVETLTELGVPQDQWQEVLTKASILEREAGISEDLPKVARVIQNRLENVDAETVGLLQMDSTVLYGVGKSGGIPTTDDLRNENPYNTYLNKGLPPAPIATPSIEAIEATLNPAEGSWLYFVTINLDTGETLFADTLTEHEANIRLLTEWCAANADRC